MRVLLLSLVAAIAVLGIAFWIYRGTQVFRRQLSEFEPTAYESSEAGRQSLERAAAVSERVSWVLSDGSRQSAFYVAPRNGALIVYAHGSPGNGLGLISEALVLAERGYGALLIDLPGYGASEGRRAWDAMFVESIRRAVDFAVGRPEVEATRIGGFGYSNGGSLIARAAAADERLSAIVLLATYSNLAEQLHHAFKRRTPGMGHFAIAASLWSGVPVSKLDTVAALQRMKPRPTLVISGGQDRQIPLETADRLKRAMPGADEIVFDEAGHLDFSTKLGDRYFSSLAGFWDRSLGSKPGGRDAGVGAAKQMGQ
jgi:pimeloyl-ACP methyl ester carboxylesterase